MYMYNQRRVPVVQTEEEKDKAFYNNPKRLTKIETQKLKHPNILPTFVKLEKRYKITATNDIKVIESWILRNVITTKCRAVGIDTEFDFTKKYNPYKSGVITIATKQACLIIQTKTNVEKYYPKNLVWLFTNDAVSKVFYEYNGDMHMITTWLNRFPNVKLQEAVNLPPGYHNIEQDRLGLKNLCRRVLGKELRKDPAATFSRWSRKVLDKNQKQYAAEDAFATLKIYNKLKHIKSNPNVAQAIA